MRRCVLDASAAVHAVLSTPRAPAILERLSTAAVVLAPSLFVAEVANTLWKYVRRGDLDVDEALVAWERAIALVDEVAADRELGIEALAEAARADHPVYDLLYALLGRRYGAAVLTEDARLAGLLEQLGVARA